MKATYLVSATIVDERSRQVGTAMLDVAWPRAPRDRQEVDLLASEETEASWERGSLARTHRYRIISWSEYAR